jgi:hypothetical protein
VADEFDFSSISQQVSEYLTKGDSGAPSGDAPSAPASDSGQSAPDPSPAQGGQPSEAKSAPDPVVEVDFGDGRVEKLTPKQIKEGYLRQQDYTKKTQELATQRKQAEQVFGEYQKLAQERQEVISLLQNPQALMYLAQQQLAASQGSNFDPNAPASLGQAQELAQAQTAQLAQYVQQLEHAMDERDQQTKAEAAQLVKDQLEYVEYSKSITNTLDKVWETHPVLKAVPEIEDVIRFRVAQMQPQTIEETLQAFEKVGEQVAKQLGEKFSEVNKAQSIAKQKLVNQGIEPPGGSGLPASQPQSYRDPKTNTLDWNRLSDAARAYVEGKSR